MLGEKLKKLRIQKRITQQQMAEILNINRTTYNKYETGAIIPPSYMCKELSEYFNVSVDYLLEINQEKKKGFKIPVLGYVKAGIPIEAVEEIVDYEEITEELSRTGEFFGLTIKGDSMEPRIKNNDVVIVKKQPTVENGQVAVILVNGQDATVKKISLNENGMTLIPFNSSYEPISYSNKEIKELPVEIIGRVVELRGKF